MTKPISFYNPICHAAALNALVRALFDCAIHTDDSLGLEEVAHTARGHAKNALSCRASYPETNPRGWNFTAKLMTAIADAIDAELEERAAQDAAKEETR